MIDQLRPISRRRAVTLRQSLDLAPIRQQPSLKIMQCNMRMESGLISNPQLHLLLCIISIRKIACARVHVAKRNHRIEGLIPLCQMVANDSSKLFLFWNSSVAWMEAQCGHSVLKFGRQEKLQRFLKGQLSLPLNENNDSQVLAPS